MKILTNKIWWNKINILSLYSKLNNMKKNVSSEKISGEFVNMTKKVHDSFPSIFTKDDVVLLLIDLEQRIVSHETEESTSSGVDVKELVQRIKDSVRESIVDYDFEENIFLDVNHNRQIEISFDTEELVKECKHSINEAVEEYLEEEV